MLDNLGMAVDFAEVKAIAKIVIDEVDHHHLNDIPPFDTINPTAENISAWLYQRLGTLINTQNLTVSAVTLWETDRSRVQYSEGRS